jgi:hypothetical protein
MRTTPWKAGRSRLAFALLAAGLLFLPAGGVALAQVSWPVYAFSGDGGSVSPAGTIYVPDGAAVSFSFIPAPGYMVYQVFVDGIVVAGSVAGYTLVDVHGKHSVQVTFAAAPAVQEYGVEIVVPGPDLFVFGGDFDRRRDAHEFSRRGSESRREAHPEFRAPERPRGGERSGGERGGGERGGAPRGGERGGRR